MKFSCSISFCVSVKLSLCIEQFVHSRGTPSQNQAFPCKLPLFRCLHQRKEPNNKHGQGETQARLIFHLQEVGHYCVLEDKNNFGPKLNYLADCKK